MIYNKYPKITLAVKSGEKTKKIYCNFFLARKRETFEMNFGQVKKRARNSARALPTFFKPGMWTNVLPDHSC